MDYSTLCGWIGATDYAIEIINQVAEEYETVAWQVIYDKVLSLEERYAESGDVDNVNSCIKLQNLMQYFKEELQLSGNSEQLNGWIPVEEKLPKEGGRYLTCDERGNIHIFSFKNGHFYDEFLHQITNYHNRYNVPIAWQPLPEPYQKGE